MLELYENIRKRRRELGMSQDELAKKVGYSSRSMISHVESGNVDLPLNKITAFATALKTTSGELMGNTEPSALTVDADEPFDIDLEDVRVAYRNMNEMGRKRLAQYARQLTQLEEYTK